MTGFSPCSSTGQTTKNGIPLHSEYNDGLYGAMSNESFSRILQDRISDNFLSEFAILSCCMFMLLYCFFIFIIDHSDVMNSDDYSHTHRNV